MLKSQRQQHQQQQQQQAISNTSMHKGEPDSLPGPYTALLQSSFIGRRRDSQQDRILNRSVLMLSPKRGSGGVTHKNTGPALSSPASPSSSASSCSSSNTIHLSSPHSRNSSNQHSSFQFLNDDDSTNHANNTPGRITTTQTQARSHNHKRNRLRRKNKRYHNTRSKNVANPSSASMWKGPLFGRVSSRVTVFVIDGSDAMMESPMSVRGINTSRFGFAVAEVQLVMQRHLLAHALAHVGVDVRVNVAVVDVDGAVVLWQPTPQSVTQTLVDGFAEFTEHVQVQRKRRRAGGVQHWLGSSPSIPAHLDDQSAGADEARTQGRHVLQTGSFPSSRNSSHVACHTSQEGTKSETPNPNPNSQTLTPNARSDGVALPCDRTENDTNPVRTRTTSKKSGSTSDTSTTPTQGPPNTLHSFRDRDNNDVLSAALDAVLGGNWRAGGDEGKTPEPVDAVYVVVASDNNNNNTGPESKTTSSALLLDTLQFRETFGKPSECCQCKRGWITYIC
jgi:hypothetical protein